MTGKENKGPYHNKHFHKSMQTHKSLAQERTILANERSTLAYIRTGFAAFALGFGLIHFFENDPGYKTGGWMTVIAGVIFIVMGLVYYPLRNRRIRAH